MLSSILWGLGFVVAGVLIKVVYHAIKASKNPDVQAATDLQISITRFHQYQRLYDAHWDVMMKYGPNSSEAERFFAKEVYPHLTNLNEWRRYENYRAELQRKEMMEQISSLKLK